MQLWFPFWKWLTDPPMQANNKDEMNEVKEDRCDHRSFCSCICVYARRLSH